MSTLRTALYLSMAGQYLGQILGFVSIVIVARLLTPREVGVFSVALSLVVVAQELRNFGIAQYVIQEPRLDEEKIRAAIGMIFVTSWGLAAILALASGAVADFFGEPGVRSVLLVLAATFVIMPFGGVVQSTLARGMDFGTLLRIRVPTQISHAVGVVVLAYLGFSYMSMAWAALISMSVSVLLTNVWRPPGLPWLPSLRGLGRIFSFGSLVSAGGLLRMASRGIPEVVIGRALDLASVGLFSRAFGLVTIFDKVMLQALRPVILPHFSAERREDTMGPAPYLRVVRCLTGLAWPFYGFLLLMAYPVVRLLFGSQWDAAVPIAQVLCVWGMAEALYGFGNEALISLGSIRALFLKELIVLLAKIMAVVLLVRFGLEAVAVAVVLVGLLEFFVVGRALRVSIGVGPGRVLRATGRSLGVAVFSILVPVAVRFWYEIGPESYLVPLLIASLGAAAGWLIGLHVFKHDLLEEVQVVLKRAASMVRGLGRAPVG